MLFRSRDAQQRALGLLPVLLEHVDVIKQVLKQAGHGDAAGLLLSAAEQQKLNVYNPYLEELLRASAEIGYVVVIHNDWGLARILENARFASAAPDERYGMPLLGLLAKYPNAKVSLAHLGVGKFTHLTVEHLRLIQQVLGDPRLRHVRFDISWDEVARHLMANAAVTDEFVELVRAHPDRLVTGSDAVKPESLGQYVRHSLHLEPLYRRIQDEVGEVAFANLRHANLERLIAQAQADVQQWAYAQYQAGWAWELLGELPEQVQQRIQEWLSDYEERHGPFTDQQLQALRNRVVDAPNWRDGSDPHTEQLRQLIRWTKATTPQVVAGRRLTIRQIAATWRALRGEHRLARAYRKQQAELARADRVLPRTRDTEALQLHDNSNNAYTLEALVAAYHAQRAVRDLDQVAWVLHEVQRSELQRRADAAKLEQLRKRLLRKLVISLTAFTTVTTAVMWMLWPLIGPAASAGAWVLRGALVLYRNVKAQAMRILVESILERGQFNPTVIRRIANEIHYNARFERITPDQHAAFNQTVNQILITAVAITTYPLGRQHPDRKSVV